MAIVGDDVEILQWWWRIPKETMDAASCEKKYGDFEEVEWGRDW